MGDIIIGALRGNNASDTYIMSQIMSNYNV